MTRLPLFAAMLPFVTVAAACAASPGASTVTADERARPPSGSDVAARGRIGEHGMVMFGEETLFLSHIPMFHAPHDMQLVLQAKVALESRAAPSSFSDRLYTFLPEPFSLDALRSGELKRIRGDVYEGNFEDGGRAVAAGVTLSIERVVFARELLSGDPEAAHLEYLAIGSRRDAYVVHRIGRAPGFDHIASVRLGDAALTDEALAAGVALSFDAPDVAARRLTGDAPLSARGAAGATQVTVVRQLSCLVGPDFDAPCR